MRFYKLQGMTHQPGFSRAEFADKKKITRREQFLTRMAALIPWAKRLAVIEPFYPKGERGRPPIGLERMLRVYFLQQWHGLADEALADALHDRQALQGFARIETDRRGRAGRHSALEIPPSARKAKAAVRAFVEPPFHILKNIFRHRKVRDRGLAKNGHQLYPLFGLANVVIGGRTATT